MEARVTADEGHEEMEAEAMEEDSIPTVGDW